MPASAFPVYASTRDLADGPVYNIVSDIALADLNKRWHPLLRRIGLREPVPRVHLARDQAHPGQLLIPTFYPITALHEEVDKITTVDYDGCRQQVLRW